MEVATDIAKLNYNEKLNILHIEMIEGAEMNLENTIRHYNEIDRITGGKRHRVLINSSRFFTADTDSFKYSVQKKITSKRIAVAYYGANLANKLLLQFYRAKYKPPMPARIFKTQQEAISWLLSCEQE